MTKKIRTKAAVRLYRCDECGLAYREKNIACRCAAWCRKHKSCNLSIIAHAVSEAGAAHSSV